MKYVSKEANSDLRMRAEMIDVERLTAVIDKRRHSSLALHAYIDGALLGTDGLIAAFKSLRAQDKMSFTQLAFAVSMLVTMESYLMNCDANPELDPEESEEFVAKGRKVEADLYRHYGFPELAQLFETDEEAFNEICSLGDPRRFGGDYIATAIQRVA